MALGAQPFNYTDALDALPNTIPSSLFWTQTAAKDAMVTDEGLFVDPLVGAKAHVGATQLSGVANSVMAKEAK